VSADTLILDTHAWIWFLAGDARLRPPAREAIASAGDAGRALVPAIAVWEVSMLEAKGRLVLGSTCAQWVEAAFAHPGLELAPLTPAVAVASNQLPGGFHGDPANRMIVATARVLDATLVTRDRAMLAYGRRGQVRILRA
jgi:PIN domain nuclease of toxin-antitoxin system